MGASAIVIPGVEILDELGRGRHSIVFRARRAGRYCAVKIPLENGAAEAVVGQAPHFLREAVSLARVNHTALPSVMEVGTVGKVPYMIMELVAGETLRERLHRGPLPESRVVELGVQLADALVEIHAAGLAHRDISVTNVLFDSITNSVRLIDFGFATDAGPTPGEVRSTSLQGTQLKPRSEIQADLQELGAVLFQCATGSNPYTELDPRPILERSGADVGLINQLSGAVSRLLRRLLLGTEGGYLDASSLARDLRLIVSDDSAPKAPPEGQPPIPVRRAFPLVGRQKELLRLRSALRASTTGHSQLVVIRGLPGSGKSRLIEVLLETARESHRYLVAVCEQSRQEPFSAIRKLLEAQLAEYDESPAPDRIRAISRFRSLSTGVAPLLRLMSATLYRALKEPQGTTKDPTAALVSDEALADFLAKLWSAGPARVVVVDDVQWLDAGSRRVLGHLSDSKEPRVLYVLAGRDDNASWPALSRLLRALATERLWEIALEALEEEQIAELLRSYLGTERIDGDLLRHVSNLGDSTPLGALEVLRSLLEGGALLPYWGAWQFDSQTASRLGLPRGSVELLIRRTQMLDPATLETLATAATIGMHFRDELLTTASSGPPARVADALAEARHALLIETTPQGHRFIHDAVREALLAGLSSQQLRAAHQRVAVALDREERQNVERAKSEKPLIVRIPDYRGGSPDFELNLGTEDEDPQAAQLIFSLATHYAEGELEKTPKRTLELCLLAGSLAFRTYDSALALRFFDVARETARLSDMELGVDFELAVAEAQLRSGALDSALQRLAIVVKDAPNAVARAHALSRVAWAEMQIDVDRAWDALFSAFRTLDVRAPSGSFSGILRALLSWLFWLLGPRPRLVAATERPRLTVLCQLNEQTARLAADTGKLGRLFQSVLSGLRSAERLGPSSALTSAYLLYAFILASFGLRKRVRYYVRAADEVARATKDPAVYARSLQISAAVAAWTGDTREALAIGSRSLHEYGHWRELSEYCITAYNQQQIEGVRGRCLDGWRHLEHAVSKLSKHEGPPMALEFIEHSVRAALTALGRSKDAEPLLTRLSAVTTRPPSRGAVLLTSYGSLVRRFTECGNLGPEFEVLVAEVTALQLDPRKVHLEVVEYYVHVAHARVHACLRAHGDQLASALEKLHGALQELRMAARIPLIKAHAIVVEGYAAFLAGNTARAELLFDRAYALATSEGMPWILYAIHRGHAHIQRAKGVSEAAMDQARLAEAIAIEHGTAHRARWIREEFSLRQRFPYGSSGLTPPSPEGSPVREGLQPKPRFRPRGYLKSLVRIGQHAAREFGVTEQARVVLGELIEAARADRGFLFLTSDRLAQEQEMQDASANAPDTISFTLSSTKDLVPIVGQNADGGDLSHESQYDRQILEEALSAQQHADDAGLPNVVCVTQQDRAIMSASLMIRGERMGAVYLDRPLAAGPFSDTDSRALAALAIQAPLVFELARFLRERERAEETQRSAEKLDAIGRLAGGIAHDFNNMLSVILGVSDQILGHRSSRTLTEDIKTVQSAAERARDLTRQLLAFSRGQYLRPEVLQLNELIQRLEPLLRQLVGDGTELMLRLDPELCRVKADPAQIDQVLTNLVVNARDAMPNGGSLSIETSNLTLTGDREPAELGLPAGRYARLTVADTGTGMDGDTLAKVFEPFFTTKPTGNGLGLPTAYGIVKQSGGHIDAESRKGIGTTFRILLPETEQRPSIPAPSQRPGERACNETVLLVDDEPLVREATRRTLRSLGYQVVGAKSAEDALRLVAEQGESLHLVITDVMMPGMNGLELARELGKIRPSLKVLLMSGYTAGVLVERGFLRDNVDFLQKPVSRDALAQRLRELLDAVH